jgi:hypothetical protein
MSHHTISFGQALWLGLLGVILMCVATSFIYGELERRAMRWYNTNQPIVPQQPKPWHVRAYEFLNS